MGLFDIFKKKQKSAPAEPAERESAGLPDVAGQTDSNIPEVETVIVPARGPEADVTAGEVLPEAETPEEITTREPEIAEDIPSETEVPFEQSEQKNDVPAVEVAPDEPRKGQPVTDTQEKKELNKGLEKTRQGLFGKLARAIAGRSRVDEGVLDDLEEVLITSDVGVDTTVKIIERIEKRVARDKYMNSEELQRILREEIADLLQQAEANEESFGLDARPGEPYVVMVVGVNGVGKTTTIGKLAAKLVNMGKKVYIGAADTFRAAAIDQLQVWADRAGATMIRQQMGSDPASVAFDTLKSAVANDADVILIDTAGRLHNKIGLMNELTKIRNVMAKVIPDAPHEVMLVLDGSTGQNAFEQAKQFTEATKVTSLAITKLDGTAKGGVVIGISDRFRIPVRFIGIGEGIDQLRVFDREEFVDALFGR